MKQQSNKKRPENAWKCICESLELQNFPGEQAGPPYGRRPFIYLPVTLKYPLVQKLIETPAYQFLKILANCMESMLFHCFYDC